MMVYKIRINGGDAHEVQTKPDAILVNNREITFDRAQINAHTYHLIRQQQSYAVEVVKADFKAKQFLFKINGKPAEVVCQDEFDQLIAQMGLQAAEDTHEKDIKAPMPGLILSIAVQEGQAIEKGDTLLTLEAMKMENVIKSPTQGVVAAIRVKEGQSVEKSQLLVVIA